MVVVSVFVFTLEKTPSLQRADQAAAPYHGVTIFFLIAAICSVIGKAIERPRPAREPTEGLGQGQDRSVRAVIVARIKDFNGQLEAQKKLYEESGTEYETIEGLEAELELLTSLRDRLDNLPQNLCLKAPFPEGQLSTDALAKVIADVEQDLETLSIDHSA